MNNTTTPPTSGFYGLGIAPKLLEILDRAQFTVPTPIQEQAIPIAIQGKDLMGIAQTGTGKTLAFALPMIQLLQQTKGTGLIVTPTRELALQIEETFQKIGRPVNVRTTVLIGGASSYHQIQQLKKNPHVIVATPGRLNDLIEQRKVRLENTRVLVLDEADRMLDMGFEPQIKRILKHLPKERQTMLFSATMPGTILKIANSYMKLPVRVEIGRAGAAAENVTQEVFVVKKENKLRLLESLLKKHEGTALIFSRTKHGARKIARAVRDMGHTAAEIHSDRTLAQRRAALDGFKKGTYRVLVATDIASRGIDVKNIELVLNYDLPDNTDDYVHRIGRTGRAGQSGHAISFATPDQGRDVREIEKLTRTMLPVSPLPDLPDGRPSSFPSASDSGFNARSRHRSTPSNGGRRDQKYLSKQARERRGSHSKRRG